MYIEFVAGIESYDVLFAGEFNSVPRVGETVSQVGESTKYEVTAVHYVIMPPREQAGVICVVEKKED